MNFVTSPKLTNPATSWMIPINSAIRMASGSAPNVGVACAAMVVAMIRLIELVGPKT